MVREFYCLWSFGVVNCQLLLGGDEGCLIVYMIYSFQISLIIIVIIKIQHLRQKAQALSLWFIGIVLELFGEGVVDDTIFKKDILELVKIADLGISDIDTQEKDLLLNDEISRITDTMTVHKKFDKDNNFGSPTSTVPL